MATKPKPTPADWGGEANQQTQQGAAETAAPATIEDRLASLENKLADHVGEYSLLKKVLTKFGIDLPHEVGANAEYLASITEETPVEETPSGS